jgi:hypothetical protein
LIKDIKIDELEQKIGSSFSAVIFWRPECGCSVEALEALREYADALETLKAYTPDCPDIQFFSMERMKGNPLFERFGLKGYPTIVIYAGGERVDQYDGFSTAAHMESFLNSLTLPQIS